MNFVSWINRPVVIRENNQRYINNDALIEESIAKTLKPVMNKMKKLNIGLPYRDARLFFFNFLKDRYPETVPEQFETRKPAAKDVNALVGQIAMNNPDLLDKISEEFETYANEEADSGVDRVSQFLNVTATLRQGKMKKPKKNEASVKRDYRDLKLQDIAATTTDAIASKKDELSSGDDVSDEKLLIKTAVSSVLSRLEDTEMQEEILYNVADAFKNINTISQFKRFLSYLYKFEEYHDIHEYLVETLNIIEKNLKKMQSQTEDEEDNYPTPKSNRYELDSSDPDVRLDPRELSDNYDDDFDIPNDLDDRFDPDLEIGIEDGECNYSDEEEFDKKLADLNKDGKLSSYEKARGEAIAKAMKKEKQRANLSHSRAVADHYNDEEDEQIAMTSKQVNQYMVNQYRQKLQSQYGYERQNRHGY